MRVGELAPPLANWIGLVRAVLGTVVQESWPAHYHPGLWVSPPHLWPAGACKGASSTDPNLQSLHDTGQQQDIKEESLWGSSIDSIAEDQWTFTSSVDKRAHWDTLWHTTASTTRFFFFFPWGGCKGGGRVRRDRERNGIGVHDVKFTESKK